MGDSGFSAAERDAMKARSAEVRAERSRGKGEAKAAKDRDAALAAIAAMPDADRILAERVHAIVAEVAPQLAARTWYGMPAYTRDGKVVCFFKAAEKFGSRFATLGFDDAAALDDGAMWATSYAIAAIGDDEERRIRDLVRRAAGSPAS